MIQKNRKGKETLILLTAAFLVIAGTIVGLLLASHGSGITLRSVRIDKGDVLSAVSTTGTLKLINTVDINSQISGKIARVLADYNQRVKKGQALAMLDTTLLKLAVDDASGNLEKAGYQLEQSRKTYSNTLQLYQQNFKSQDELDSAEVDYKSAKIALKGAEISLSKARIDLSNAVITSPMDGVVVDKNAIVGQFVNLNISETALFVVSSDLEKMEIYASVAESDISRVKKGQKVIFTVTTYSGKSFNGRVAEIHLKPTTTQNVVYYTVVVEVDNREKLLYPGMTATLSLIFESRTNVLKVVNSAFKFKPSPDMIAKPELPSGLKIPGTNTASFLSSDRVKAPNVSVLFIQDKKTGKLRPVPVKIGLNDGQSTEISVLRPEDGEFICEGAYVVSGKSVQSGKNTVREQGAFSQFGGPMGPGPGPR